MIHNDKYCINSGTASLTWCFKGGCKEDAWDISLSPSVTFPLTPLNDQTQLQLERVTEYTCEAHQCQWQ